MDRNYTVRVTKEFVQSVQKKIDNDDRIGKTKTYDQVAYNWWCEFFDHILPTVEPCKHINESYKPELQFEVDNHYWDKNYLVDNKVARNNGTAFVSDDCIERFKKNDHYKMQPINWHNKPWRNGKFTQPKEGDIIKFSVGRLRSSKEVVQNTVDNIIKIEEFQ